MVNKIRSTRIGGFTFVELMVVITVIGILSSIGYASYNQVRMQARDARRMDELESIAKVFALDLVETGTSFECENGIKIEDGMPDIMGDCADKDDMEALLLEYFPEVPHDPLGPSNDRFFYYYDHHGCGGGVGSRLILFAQMEVEGNSNREEVCPKLDSSVGGGNNQGYYNYNTLTSEENYPYAIIIQ